MPIPKLLQCRPLLPIVAGLVALACTRKPVPTDGLWDAHTHISWWGEDALDSLTRYGIVAVRDCGGDVQQLRKLRNAIAAGARKGPRIYFAGPQIDGPKDNDSLRLIVRTPGEASKAVDSLAALGVDFIKTHSALSRLAYFAVLREAKRKGLKVASHLPAGVPAWEAADSGASSIEHAAESLLMSPISAGYARDLDGAMAWWRSAAGDSAIAHLARAGVAVTPTLFAYSAFADDAKNHADSIGRREVLLFQAELTLRLHRAGVPLLAGSDFATRDWIPPGRSLLGEIQLLQTAGLSAGEARAAASTNVETWLQK